MVEAPKHQSSLASYTMKSIITIIQSEIFMTIFTSKRLASTLVNTEITTRAFNNVKHTSTYLLSVAELIKFNNHQGLRASAI